MFKRIRSYFRDIRIYADFKRYEKSEFSEHENEANRRFNDSSEKSEIESINRKVKEESDSRFDQSIAGWKAKIQDIEGDLSALTGMLQVFTRAYSEEISSLHDQKSTLYERKKPLYDEMDDLKARLSVKHDAKSRAYDALSSAKSSIDSWYSKSQRGFFGNAGRELPRHSLFGQSFGDLDYYKGQRDQAGNQIQDLNSSISRLKGERSSTYHQIVRLNSDIEIVKADIQKAKDDRRKMYDLMREGHTRHKLQLDVKLLSGKQADAKEELYKLQRKREIYEGDQEEKYGLSDIVKKSEELERLRAAFLRNFNTPSKVEERKRVHRKKWLAERGLL